MERRPVHLPGEIIEEILLRVAVKSLLRFRCVSKSYCSLIDSKRFIRTHHQKSSRDSSLAHHRVLRFSYSHTDELDVVLGCSSLLSVLDGSADDKTYLVGCCNGLVCILLSHYYNNSSQLILWNPSTRVFRVLPYIDKINKYRHVGFGWDEWSDDYKVIVLSCLKGHNMCKLYTLKTDSWKEIDACDIHDHLLFTDIFGKLANGKLYWKCQGSSERWIIAFDLNRDVFETVEQPRYSEGYFYACLGTFGEEFAVMYCNNMGYKEIWAKKEYIYNGVKDESWVKVLVDCDDYAKCDIWTSPCVHAFQKGSKGEILLISYMFYYGKNGLAYDLKNKLFHRRAASDIYVESLVSPFVTNVGLERDEPNHPTPARTKLKM